MNLARSQMVLQNTTAFMLPWICMLVVRGSGGALYVAIGLYVLLALLAHRHNLMAYAANKAGKIPLGFVGAFLTVAVTCLFFSPAPADAADLMLKTIAPLLGLLAFCALHDEQSSQWSKALVSGYVLALLLFICQYLLRFSFLEITRAHPTGEWLLDLNRPAMVLGLLYFPVASHLNQFGSPLMSQRIRQLLLLAVTMTCIILSDSNTTQIAMLAGLATYAASLLLPSLLIARLFFSVIAGLFIAVPFAFPLFDKGLSIIAPIWDETSSTARLEIWRAVVEKISLAPLHGYGFSAARYIDFGHQAANTVMPKDLHILHPHNVILQLWLEFGLAGALVILYGLWLGYKAVAMQEIKQQRVLLALATCLFAMSLTGYGLWQLWILTAAILALFYCQKPSVQ